MDHKVFFTCLVNWMDGPGQVESKEGGGGGDEDGGQVELLLPHLQVSMVMAGKVRIVAIPLVCNFCCEIPQMILKS